MKTAIIYDSRSGNTKEIAMAIKEEINPDELVYCGAPKEDIDADMFIVGSWTDKGTCSAKIADFLSSLKNKHIAYFGTAGYGGSSDYYKAIYSRVEKHIDSSNTMYGYFFCQGKMPMAVRDRYVKMITENPEDSDLKVSIANFDEALLHPNDKDLTNAKNWTKDLFE